MVYGTPTKKGGYGGGLGSMAKHIASERQAKEAREGPQQSTYKPIGLKSLSEELNASKEAGRAGPAKPVPRPGSDPHSQIIYPKKKEDPMAQPAEPVKPRDLAAEHANTIIIYPKKKDPVLASVQPVKTEEQPAEGPEEQPADDATGQPQQ